MGLRAPHDTVDQRAEWESLLTRIKSLLDSSESSNDLQTEFSARFIKLAIGAMLVSRHKYGLVAEGFPAKIDAIGASTFKKRGDEQQQFLRDAFQLLGSLGRRLDWYFFGQLNPDYGEPGEPKYAIEPGNAEYLVDAANYCLIEFMHPGHPAARYEATDRWGSPGRRTVNTAIYGEQANQFANREVADADEVSSLV